jgi:hypothetical protein
MGCSINIFTSYKCITHINEYINFNIFVYTYTHKYILIGDVSFVDKRLAYFESLWAVQESARITTLGLFIYMYIYIYIYIYKYIYICICVGIY